MREIYYSNDGSISAERVGSENGKPVWEVCYRERGGMNNPYYEAHEISLYEWAKHLHGNAPSGTPYGYFRASRNGKRVIITV